MSRKLLTGQNNLETKTAVIIEDEERSQIVLQNLIKHYCPEVEVIGVADSVDDGINCIRDAQPDIIFLDVQIYDGSGFDILERLGDITSSVIFTTAFDQYAVKAFKFSAIDYLLKPIDIKELKAAVKRVVSRGDRAVDQDKIHNLLTNMRKSSEPPVLLVSTSESNEFVRLSEIIHCQADGAYTMLYLSDSKPVLVSRVIKEFELLLTEYGFFRVHQSHIVNLNEIRKFIKPDNCILMRDGTRIQVARSRKEGFFDAMKTVQL